MQPICSEGVTWLLVFKFLILGGVFIALAIFFLKKVLFDSTQGAVNRLNRETEAVRAKQIELNEKIKQANEELAKRRSEADALVAKMKEDAESKAKDEREKIIAKARQDAEEVISKAQKTKDEIRKVLEKEAEVKALDFANVLLKEVFSARALLSLNENLIDEFISSLESVDMSMVAAEINTVDVITTIPLADKFRTRLDELLKKKLDRELKYNMTQDTKINSGIILRFGSLTLNGSLAYALQEKGMQVKELLEKGLLGKTSGQ
jgi:F0F1-type ATP synthase membrane subunit b/b'